MRFVTPKFAVAALSFLGLACLAAPANASGIPNGAPAPFRDGIILMAFQTDVSQLRQTQIIRRLGATELKRIGVGVHVLAVPPGLVRTAIQRLQTQSEVRYAEPDFIQALDGGAPPNDTSFGNQWAALNTGQTANGVTGTPGADERSIQAWSVTTGANAAVVAVLDSGVQYTHPDLFPNMWNNPGGVGSCAAGTHGYNVLSANCDPMDDDLAYGGHGTHVAGILGAVGNNAAGVAGVNWAANIMAVKWVGSDANGLTSDVISAMDWVVRAKQAGVNVRVVNDSATWAGTAFSQALSDEIDLLGSNDILVVTAAGNTAENNDTTPRYPCSYDRPNMICVGASDQNDNLWSSSNYGITTVKLAAPGVNIFSTLRLSDFGYISGGSMASPQVAGTALLILSLGYQPVSTLRSMILNNVDKLSSLSSFVATGGRLNVCKAVPGCASGSTSRPVSSGLPVITGNLQSGSVLGASSGIWTGLPTGYLYQWYRCNSSGANCSPIAGAVSQTYAPLASADVGSTLSVAVTGSNSSGSGAAQSIASVRVAAASSPFAISSTILDGQNISGTLQWKATPAQPPNFVQFYIDGGLSQTGTGSPYLYNQSSTGLLDTTTLPNGTHVLGLRALASDNRSYGFYGATVNVSNPPQNTVPPAVSGSPVQGQTISTSNGTWTNNPTAYAYQWNRCDINGSNCSFITGATGAAYMLTNADVGATIRSSVTATNAFGSNGRISNPTAVVQATARLSITTTSLPAGTRGIGYIAALAATGGDPPYHWSILSGTLPPGLILSSKSSKILGTPTTPGTSTFTLEVSGVNSKTAQTATRSFSITIN